MTVTWQRHGIRPPGGGFQNTYFNTYFDTYFGGPEIHILPTANCNYCFIHGPKTAVREGPVSCRNIRPELFETSGKGYRLGATYDLSLLPRAGRNLAPAPSWGRSEASSSLSLDYQKTTVKNNRTTRAGPRKPEPRATHPSRPALGATAATSTSTARPPR